MTNFKPVRIVVVGCGAVTTLYYTPALRMLQESGMLQVIALFDPNPESVAQLHYTFSRLVALVVWTNLLVWMLS